MPGGIFLLQGGDSLVEMTEKDYDSEELLQKLLADYPNLLAGDQIDSDSPRRWLLIGREVGVPLEEAGGNAMSLDHLFLDQDGVPTLVEVKRSSDVRIRREVIGQMLDYAANASAYWPADQIQQLFEQRCEAETSYCLFVIYTYGRVEMQFEGLARRAPFDQRSLRLELLQRLNRLRGVSIPETKLDKRPSIALSLLSDEKALGQFLETMEWALQVIQAA